MFITNVIEKHKVSNKYNKQLWIKIESYFDELLWNKNIILRFGDSNLNTIQIWIKTSIRRVQCTKELCHIHDAMWNLMHSTTRLKLVELSTRDYNLSFSCTVRFIFHMQFRSRSWNCMNCLHFYSAKRRCLFSLLRSPQSISRKKDLSTKKICTIKIHTKILSVVISSSDWNDFDDNNKEQHVLFILWVRKKKHKRIHAYWWPYIH